MTVAAAPEGGLLTDRDGPVLTLTLAREGRANALDTATVDALRDAVSVADPDATRVLVLRGAGRHFSGGFDLDGREDDDELVRRFLAIQDVLDRLRAVPCLTVAVVHGAAVGAGADLVAACDVRIGTPDARLSFPGIRFGLTLGTRQLVHVIGHGPALDVLLRGRELVGRDAADLGLLTHLVDDRRAADALVSSTIADVLGLAPAAVSRLLSFTRCAPDAAERDALVASLTDGSIRDRIATYRSGAAEHAAPSSTKGPSDAG